MSLSTSFTQREVKEVMKIYFRWVSLEKYVELLKWPSCNVDVYEDIVNEHEGGLSFRMLVHSR